MTFVLLASWRFINNPGLRFGSVCAAFWKRRPHSVQLNQTKSMGSARKSAANRIFFPEFFQKSGQMVEKGLILKQRYISITIDTQMSILYLETDFDAFVKWVDTISRPCRLGQSGVHDVTDVCPDVSGTTKTGVSWRLLELEGSVPHGRQNESAQADTNSPSA